MNLQCVHGTLAGPVDDRCIKSVEREYGFQIDPGYRALLPTVHGGVPCAPYFKTSSGIIRQIGRFVPIVDIHSTINPPFQPFAQDPSIDRRVYQSLEHILGRDSSCFYLGFRVRLIPFAALVTRDIHPDALDHTNCECDFVCFDTIANPQSITLFRSADAGTEYWRHEESDDNLAVEYESFTEPLASCLAEFAAKLSSSTPQTT